MSRNLVILLVVLSAGVAGLIVFSRLRSKEDASPVVSQIETAPTAAPSTGAVLARPRNPATTAPAVAHPTITNQALTATAGQSTPAVINAVTNVVPDLALETKPLPVLEKDYLATTNRDTRLDIMMDIAENSTADTVKALTRLFEAETDMDLKVDLLDSLLGIEEFKEEKLVMLTLGTRQGLPNEVRQAAVDGLIDLDDPRVIPVLNGLLNDPDTEIRETAKDALEMLQAEPAVKLK